MRNSVEKKFKHSKNYSSCILRFVHTVYSVVPRPLSRDFRVTWKKNQPIHRWATGVLPPQTNDLFTTVHPHTGWPPEVAPEAAEKVTIFVQNCQNFAAFRRLSRKFSSFVFYSPPGLGLQKPLPPPAEIWLIPLPVADRTPTYILLYVIESSSASFYCSSSLSCLRSLPPDRRPCRSRRRSGMSRTWF